MNNIKKQMNAINKKIDNLYSKKQNLQLECHHENLQGRYGANTGNYSSSDDYYWVDFMCSDCGKRWTEDQQDQAYINKQHLSMEGHVWTPVKEFSGE